jgi:hypothetical protein
MPDGGPENPNGYLPEVLYDDGTNSGITIYLQAITTNTLSESGHGEFYNPIYGDQTTYNNTDGTGLYGIWDGDNPDPLQVPAYQVDQVVFWGGYAWKNLTGNVGVADDTLNLDPTDWEKLPYSNTTYYEKVIDEIKVDLNNGILIGRTNVENQITVEFNADQYSWWMGLWDTILKSNPIAVMGWGLYSKVTPEQLDDEFYGISNVSVINSVCETVNFKGVSFLNVEINSSYLYDNYFGKDSQFNYNTLVNNSFLNNNKLTNGSDITYNTLTDSYIQFNTLTDNGYIGTNILIDGSSIDVNDISTNSSIQTNALTKDCYIGNNTLTNSRIQKNKSSQNSGIRDNTLTNGNIDDNILTQNSIIENNTLTQSVINTNTLTSGSTVRQNTLPSSSGIQFNTLAISYINNNVLTDSTIEVNTLTNTSSIGFMTLTNNTTILFNTLISSTVESITLTNKTLGNINIAKTNLNDNLSTATDIFLNTEKKIFTRLDGTKRLLYYNTSDTPTIVNVNA